MNWLDWTIIVILIVTAFIGFRNGIIGAAFTLVGAYAGMLVAPRVAPRIGEMLSSSVSNETIISVISYILCVAAGVIIARILVKILRPTLAAFTLGLSSMADRLGGLAVGLLIGVAMSSALIIGMARLTYNFDTDALTELLPAQLLGYVDRVESVEQSLQSSISAGEELSGLLEKAEGVKGALANNNLSTDETQRQLANIDDLKMSIDASVTGAEKAQQIADLDEIRIAIQNASASVDVRIDSAREGLESTLTESAVVPVFLKVKGVLPADTLGFIPDDFKVAVDRLEAHIERSE